MGSPLGPVLANIFMIKLEKAILPELTECIKYCKRYVDDIISFVKLGTINYIITKLNSFDKNIQFAFEEEGKGALPITVTQLWQLYSENLQILTFTKRFCTRRLEKRNFKNTSGTCIHSIFY